MIDSGQPASDAATFAFTNPLFNGPLFNPVMAAVTAVQQLGGTRIDLCLIPDVGVGGGGGGGGGGVSGWGVPGLTAIAGSIPGRDYLINGTITTDVPTQPLATIAHVNAILNAPPGMLVWFTVVNNQVVSQGLSPTVEYPHGHPNSPYVAVSAGTSEWLALLAGRAAELAAAQDLSRASLAPLAGQPAPVLALGRQISQYAADTLGKLMVVYPVYALFDTYGALPVLVCVYDDGSAQTGGDHRFFLLIDGVDGTIDGPFVPGGAIRVENLLANHEEAADVGEGQYNMVNVGGCEEKYAAKSDNPKPPSPGPTQLPHGPPTAPWGLLPVGPGVPIAGDPSPWHCSDVANPGTSCRCKHDISIVCPTRPPGTPSPVRVHVTCTAPGGCDGPEPAPGSPAPGTCTYDYDY